MDRTDIALNDGRPSNASAASILLGVDAIIGRHLGCLDIGRSAPHFVHKAACLRLSTTPLPDLRACDLVREIGRTIHANWLQSDRRAAQPIAANWRFEAQLHIADDNKRLLPDCVNQVPTASHRLDEIDTPGNRTFPVCIHPVCVVQRRGTAQNIDLYTA